MSAAWYAIRTRARAEKAVRDYLGKHDVEAFLPTVTRWSRWKDRRKAVAWPLFSGYCFAHFDVADRLVVLKCPGAAGLVSTDGQPSALPDYEIENLRILVTSEFASDPAPFIKEGDLVSVRSGPLKGVVGRLVRKGDKARLILSVDLLSQAVSVTVDAADVKAY